MIVQIPATSANLGPGFDSLGLAISLYNYAQISYSKIQQIRINGYGSENSRLRTHNYFIQIFNEVFYEITHEKQNFLFDFTNNIPFSRGLGSSSAVIVGAIASAYKMAKIKASKEKILNKALIYESHPDNITPATYGGFCSSIIHEKKVKTLKKDLPNHIKAVVLIPTTSISTAKSRTTLPKKYDINECVFNISHSSFLTAAFFNENWNLLKLASKDMLHEERRMNNLPFLFEVKKYSLKNGALMCSLSGSGSTMFSLCYNDDEKNLKTKLKNKFSDCEVLSFSFDNHGFMIQKAN